MTYSFYQLKNHILNDPLSDWFSKMKSQCNRFERDMPNEFQLEIKDKKEKYKKEFINYFKKDYQNIFYENIHSDLILDKIKQNEKCIIYQGNLYHKDLKLNVQPDLIIHRDIFKEIFNQVNLELPEYIIFDILYKILHFNSNKTDLLNQSDIYYYKCKMMIASECISNDCEQGYLFGKEYRHKEKTLIKKKTIGYFNFNNDFKKTIKDALKWLVKLDKYYGEWKLLPKPSVNELYPNMNIKYGNWNTEKKKLADEIEEITLVWNISYKNRCILIDKGITKWSDPILLTNIYSYQIKENKKELIQEKMIHINSQSDLKISPRKIKNKEFITIIQNQNNSIILDIESIIHLDEDENYFEIKKNDKPRICIIGTIINNEDLIFKDFTIKYCTNEEEKKNIIHWIDFLNHTFQNEINVYHWGQAEVSYMKYIQQKYPDIKLPQFKMINLLNYFKQEPITIQGCFGYGLKEIVKQLYNLKLIENQWSDDTSGLDAMIKIIKTSEEALIKNIPIKRFTEIKKIIYYNYMDCRVIVDILKMLEGMI